MCPIKKTLFLPELLWRCRLGKDVQDVGPVTTGPSEILSCNAGGALTSLFPSFWALEAKAAAASFTCAESLNLAFRQVTIVSKCMTDQEQDLDYIHSSPTSHSWKQAGLAFFCHCRHSL